MSLVQRRYAGSSGGSSTDDAGVAAGKRAPTDRLAHRRGAAPANASETDAEVTAGDASAGDASAGDASAGDASAGDASAGDASGSAPGSTDRPSAGSGEVSTLDGQLRQLGGIRVVLARQTQDSDVEHTAGELLRGHPTRGAVLGRGSTVAQIGRSDAFRTVSAHPASEPLTHEDATLLAGAFRQNNREFMGQGTRAAAARSAIGGSPSSPTVGQPLPFLRTEDPLALVEALSVAVRDRAAPAAEPHAAPAAQPNTTPAPADSRGRRAPHVVPRTQNIVELSVFTHGIPSGVELGRLGWPSASAVAGRLSPLLAPDVDINLYACSAASGDDSFAEQLTENLARDPANPHHAHTFGHTTYGNAATLTMGRQFDASAAAPDATSTTNWRFFFDETYIAAQGERLATRLATEGHAYPPATVSHELRRNEVAVRWLVGDRQTVAALNRAMVDVGGSRLQAAFAIGFEPDAAQAAVRRLWEQDDEGLALLRGWLRAHPPRAAVTRPG
jgi:hypothetical protein